MKPRVPKSVMQGTPMLELAQACIGDFELPDDLFTLSMKLMLVGMSGFPLSLDGVALSPMDEQDTEVIILKPYGRRSLRIIEHLEAKGYVRLSEENLQGRMYVIPVPPSNRDEWALRAFQEILKFAGRPDHSVLEKIRSAFARGKARPGFTATPKDRQALGEFI